MFEGEALSAEGIPYSDCVVPPSSVDLRTLRAQARGKKAGALYSRWQDP